MTTKRVLLAEDDKVSAKIVTLGLEKLGFSVTLVGDGIAAEERLQRKRVKVCMPKAA